MRRLIPLCLALAPLLSSAADFHVSSQGNDSQAGSAAAPFATLAKARDAARPLAGRETITIHVADGTYYLPEPLILKAEDSGSEAHPILWKAEHEGKAILSGGLKLALVWKPFRDGIFQAATPPGLAIDQLFIGGVRQRMARYPDYDPAKPTAAYQGYAADAISKERAARWANPAGGYIHAMHVARWGGYHYRITGKNPDGTLAYEGGWQNNRQMGMHAEQRMVENIFEELDAPGEWFHNAKAGTLYFKPGPEINLSSAAVEVVRLNRLIDIAGTEAAPVHHVTLQGFVIRHAARTFMENREPLLRSDWTIYRGGAVTLTGANDVSILDCEFDQPGGNAVFVNNFNRRVRIKGCHIHDTGASGVCFVGDPAAVRNPLFEYAQGQDLSKIDPTAGPQTNHYPADCSVEDCLITGIGRVERQPAGVQIAMSARIALRDLSIYDCARAGINIGDGCWGGHLIERCDVFDTVLETHDHGSFNSWGRDRYWFRNHRGVSEPAVKKNPKLPYLDAVATNVIRDSRWRCDHGWDIDLDDGSSNYDIHRNLLLAGGLKFREGYGRKAHNNIIVNNGLHPHVWFDQNGDSLTGNILMKPHAIIGMPDGWQPAMDGNFFTDPAALAKCQGLGSDSKSIAIAPDFVDPARGDYRLKKGSPALKAGFENFPMDQFGVKKPALKALAKSPVFPDLEASPTQPPSNENEPVTYWLGAKLHGIEGEEFSAFGVAREDGGVQFIRVPEGSAAARAGIRENDLLQDIKGRKVRSPKDLFAALMELRDTPLEITIVRNQTRQTLSLGKVPCLLTEGASEPDGFKAIKPKAPGGAKVITQPATANEPAATLTDDKLAANYGPVFRNGVTGLYKLDLGSPADLAAIHTWSFNQGNNRAAQAFTLYGSAAGSDPGWNPADFVAIGSIDTRAASSPRFLATSLQAPDGESLGKFRWLLWAPQPLNATGENTAFQEFGVELRP